MSVIAIVNINHTPDQAFWNLEHAIAYARFMALAYDSIAIQLVRVDIVPWENTLYARKDGDATIWEGAHTTAVDATTIYRIQLH